MASFIIISGVGVLVSVLSVGGVAVASWRSTQRSTLHLAVSALAGLYLWLVIALAVSLTSVSESWAVVFWGQLALLLPVLALVVYLILTTFYFDRRWIFGLAWGALLVAVLPTVWFVFSFGHFIDGVSSWPELGLGWYFSAGSYFWLWLLILLGLWLLGFLLLAMKAVGFHRDDDRNGRDKALYCLTGHVFWFVCLAGALPPAFGWSFAPYSLFWIGLFMTVFSYGLLKVNVFDYLSFLKRSIIFALATFLVSAALVFLNILTLFLRESVAEILWWLMPVSTAIIVVSFGFLIWHQLNESKLLKYEFITVITHKFRTPLTRIKWSVSLIKATDSDEDKAGAVEEINYSVEKLVELTNILVDVNKIEGAGHRYDYRPQNLNILVQGVAASVRHRMDDKSIEYDFSFDDSYSKVQVDSQRLSFALQILFENAVNYTPGGGRISVCIAKKDSRIVFSITDTGIGIADDELPHIFSQFYRSRKAKLMDTEGVGVGLSMAKKIVERHGGKLRVSSPGPNRGSTFTVELPRSD